MVIYISNDEMEKCKKIVVVGSTNVDLIARVSHLPEPGETMRRCFMLLTSVFTPNQAI